MTRRRVLWVVLASLAVLVVVVGSVALLTAAQKSTQIRDTQLEGTPLGKKLMASADQIKSCTTPGGKCYQRGQRQQGAAINAISLRQVAAVACGDRPGTQSPAEIRACVARTMRVLAASPSTP